MTEALQQADQPVAATPSTVTIELSIAASLIAQANALLAGWNTKTTDDHRSYVTAGHDCIRALDDAYHSISRARAGLVDEIHRDEDERIVRVDALLAESRARREAEPAGVTA